MFHDPEAFADLSRRMREPQPAGDPVELPALAELIRRLEEVRQSGVAAIGPVEGSDHQAPSARP